MKYPKIVTFGVVFSLFNSIAQADPCCDGAKKAQVSSKSEGGVHGGGGGGIMINGIFYSLAEAGLKIDESIGEPYYPDSDTISAAADLLNEIEHILPAKDKSVLRKVAFGTQHHYERLMVIDPIQFEKIQKDYQSFIDTLPVEGPFKLLAYTGKDKTTYILPDWEIASPKTRALFLLTHEAPFSLKPDADLADILKFEIAVLNLDRFPNDSDSMLSVYKAMKSLNLLAQGSSLAAYYLSILELKGVDMRLGNLFNRYQIQDLVRREGRGHVELDPVVLNSYRNLDSSFFNVFYGDALFTNNIPFTEQLCPSLGISFNSSPWPSDAEVEKCVDQTKSLSLKSDGSFIFLRDNKGNEIMRFTSRK